MFKPYEAIILGALMTLNIYYTHTQIHKNTKYTNTFTQYSGDQSLPEDVAHRSHSCSLHIVHLTHFPLFGNFLLQ